jgi:hypothetical protein
MGEKRGVESLDAVRQIVVNYQNLVSYVNGEVKNDSG